MHMLFTQEKRAETDTSSSPAALNAMDALSGTGETTTPCVKTTEAPAKQRTAKPPSPSAPSPVLPTEPLP